MSNQAAIFGHNWGIRTHLPVLRQLGWEVPLLVGRDQERTVKAASSSGVKSASIEPSAAMKCGAQLLVVAVPWTDHCHLVQMGLDAGKMVLAEHPLAPTACEARQLATSANARGIPLFVNLPTRFMQPAMNLRSKLADGPIGQIREVKHEFQYPKDEEQFWLPLLLTHSLDLAEFLFNLQRPLRSQVQNAKALPLSACPSWSWPMTSPSVLRPGYFIAADSIELEFETQLGLYALSVGYGESADFVERLAVRGDHALLAYETRLSRENELSPWAATQVLTFPPDVLPTLEPATVTSGRDMWLEAHTAQMAAITATIHSRTPDIEPANANHAARIHELIEAVIDQALDGRDLSSEEHGS